ncbi:Palmitoyltransferase [Trypanosoma melophagium]|uniref:Palmitoyltransferase n=1 Tax=Trypanosoma melophagium TaxID=715481 RepID=UPI00351A9B4F|nr:Palmitoyltransferase [Trypanosoma melophagium]
MDSVVVPVNVAEDRYNDTLTALGKMSRTRWCGITCFWSPEAAVYAAPTLITAALVFGVVFTLWNELGFFELCVLFALLSTAFISSFLIVCTDPGVYPRLRLGEVDPHQNEKNLVLCRVCGVRRPPRTAHCYQCNVCVLEHDHHCGIIGGCVGQRSLRWFALYLVTVSTASGMGIYWISRSILNTVYISAQQSGSNTFVSTTPVPVPVAVAVAADGGGVVFVGGENIGGGAAADPSKLSSGRRGNHDEGALKSLAIIFLFVLLLLVLLLVGSLAVFYVYLVLTSTTRRESQRLQSKRSTLLHPKLMWENLLHVVLPPRSMLIGPQNNKNSLV